MIGMDEETLTARIPGMVRKRWTFEWIPDERQSDPPASGADAS
jgi:hypothetical protein